MYHYNVTFNQLKIGIETCSQEKLLLINKSSINRGSIYPANELIVTLSQRATLAI